MVTSKWYRFRVVENDIIWLSEACQYFNEDAIVLFSCTKILNQETTLSWQDIFHSSTSSSTSSYSLHNAELDIFYSWAALGTVQGVH